MADPQGFEFPSLKGILAEFQRAAQWRMAAAQKGPVQVVENGVASMVSKPEAIRRAEGHELNGERMFGQAVVMLSQQVAAAMIANVEAGIVQIELNDQGQAVMTDAVLQKHH